MSAIVDLTGKQFHRLTVIRRYGIERPLMWECVCSCGSTKIASGKDIKRGRIKSCGCYRKEYMREKHKTHGLSNNPLYKIWSHILSRCDDINDKFYACYGGRGISYDPAWKDPRAFINDVTSFLGVKPSKQHSIDRIDVNGGYFIHNLRWATLEEQANNKRSNKVYLVDGKTNTLANLCKKYKADYSRVYARLKLGWEIHEALTADVYSVRKNRL